MLGHYFFSQIIIQVVHFYCLTQWWCKNLLLKDKCSDLLKLIGHLSWWLKLCLSIRHSHIRSFWDILFYVDTVYNLHIKLQHQILPTEKFLKLRVVPAALGCRISEITKSSNAVRTGFELVLSHVAPAVSIHNSKTSTVKLLCEAIWPVIHV